MTPLTRRQKGVLDAIAAWDKAHGYAPTYQELAKVLGLSSLATVWHHLWNLELKGYIMPRKDNDVRAIQIVPEPVRGLKSCANGHALCYFSGDCPACGMRGAA